MGNSVTAEKEPIHIDNETFVEDLQRNQGAQENELLTELADQPLLEAPFHRDGVAPSIGTESTNDLVNRIGLIATDYVLTMGFNTLKKLHQKEYCAQVKDLTSEILGRGLTNKELVALFDHIESGTKSESESERESETMTEERRNLICQTIAEFYVTVAHVYSAIVMTVNPKFSYVSPFGITITKTLAQKSEIPPNTEFKVTEMSLCGSRHESLKKNMELDGDLVAIQPDFCRKSLDFYGDDKKQLNEEPGIPELQALYMDASFDPDTGEFSEMKPETRAIYLRDVGIMYKAFTGNKEVPPEIDSFAAIKLRNYNKADLCTNGVTAKVSGSYKDVLFDRYGETLTKMIQEVNTRQEQLLTILDDIFTVHPDSGVVNINEDITMEGLQRLVQATREVVITLYVTCEELFLTATKIYEAIVESKILEATQSQKQTLEEELEKLTTRQPPETIVLGTTDVQQDDISAQDTSAQDTSAASNTASNTGTLATST